MKKCKVCGSDPHVYGRRFGTTVQYSMDCSNENCDNMLYCFYDSIDRAIEVWDVMNEPDKQGI